MPEFQGAGVWWAGLLAMCLLVPVQHCTQPVPPTKEEIVLPVRCPAVYVGLGDSTGSGVGAGNDGGYVSRLHKHLLSVCPDVKLINASRSGAKTRDVLQTQLKVLDDTRPTLITLGIGANDVTHLVPEQEFTNNYERILARLAEHPQATVVIMNVPDVSLAPVMPQYLRPWAHERSAKFNKLIADLAQRHNGQNNLTVIDLYTRLTDFTGQRENFSPDGFHPSAQGYDNWAKLLWPIVEKSLRTTPPAAAK